MEASPPARAEGLPGVGMALSRKLMTEGEHVVLATRTHVKALALPALVLVAACGLGGFLLAVAPSSGGGALRGLIGLVALVAIGWWSVLPFLRWFSTTYTITNARLVEQQGLLTRTGRIIPLTRINDVSYEKGLTDRLVGCGTLVIHDASDQPGLRIHDVPHVEHVHRTLSTLAFDPTSHERSGDERL